MNWTRLVTIALAIACFAVSAIPALAGVAEALRMAGAGLLAWAIPHPADKVETEAPKPTNNVPPAAVALIVGLGLLAASSTAHAQSSDRQFGGCFSGGSVCLGPSASVTVGQYNVSTGKFAGGVIPGVGYGATVAADQWYQTGLAVYLSFKAGGAEPNQAIPSLMLSFANYVRVGLGLALTEQSSGPAKKDWLVSFGLGSDFGGPDPVKAYKARSGK